MTKLVESLFGSACGTELLGIWKIRFAVFESNGWGPLSLVSRLVSENDRQPIFLD